MIINDNCSFGITDDILNKMTEVDAKEYVDDLQADYWIDEYKNNL